jgi:hypothetical protein
MTNQITDYQLDLKIKITESLSVLNSLLREAKQNGLESKILKKSATIGKDGFLNCEYFEELEITLLVLL